MQGISYKDQPAKGDVQVVVMRKFWAAVDLNVLIHV